MYFRNRKCMVGHRVHGKLCVSLVGNHTAGIPACSEYFEVGGACDPCRGNPRCLVLSNHVNGLNTMKPALSFLPRPSPLLFPSLSLCETLCVCECVHGEKKEDGGPLRLRFRWTSRSRIVRVCVWMLKERESERPTQVTWLPLRGKARGALEIIHGPNVV